MKRETIRFKATTTRFNLPGFCGAEVADFFDLGKRMVFHAVLTPRKAFSKKRPSRDSVKILIKEGFQKIQESQYGQYCYGHGDLRIENQHGRMEDRYIMSNTRASMPILPPGRYWLHLELGS